jgi:hypothetical protein
MLQIRRLLLCTACAAAAAWPHGAAGAEKGDREPGVHRERFDARVFQPDPRYPGTYNPKQQIDIYGGKKKIDEPRPWIELGQKLYVEGPLQKNDPVPFGRKNLASPAFSLFGDWRTAIAYNDNGPGKRVGQIATRLNLEADLIVTATERFHAAFRPLDRNGQFTRFEFFGPDAKGFSAELDPVPRTFFFEGDVGNIVAGFTDRYQKFDLPFTVGLVPLLYQNGVWAQSTLAGGAFALAGYNSAALNISNMDFSFFAGGRATTPAIKDAAGKLVTDGLSVFGAAAFIEANEGYWEMGLGYLHDGRGLAFDASYGSATVAFTRRYGGWLSNSVRVIGTFGQDAQANGKRTADGVILLLENSLISSRPLVLVPYLNLFVGIGTPQSLMRNGDAGGILFNTGILFQTDGLTGYPKLDDTAQNTYGAALGVNYLFDLTQQIVLEAATVQVMGSRFDPTRPAKSEQYGLGARYQRNLSRSLIFRADAMVGFRPNDADIAGVRSELRWKF